MTEQAEEEEIAILAPWDGRRVPVTLLGGYLGAGKTTVINELLRSSDRPIAVLVNDVGQVNIDAALVRQHNGDTIELTDGCVCCSLSGGLAAAFDGLREREMPPEHVIVELSGIANPARVVPWASSVGFVLDGVVILVDADQFEERLADPLTSPSIKVQLAEADLFVVSKADIAADGAVDLARAHLNACYPKVPVFDSSEVTGVASLIGLGTRREGGVVDVGVPTLFDAHEVGIVRLPSPIGLGEFERMVFSLPSSTLRAKGIAVTPDGTRLLAQVVGRRRSVTVLPDAELQPPTDLVVITPKS